MKSASTKTGTPASRRVFSWAKRALFSTFGVLQIADFDFELPESLIAVRPAPTREHSRLLVLPREGGEQHARFDQLGTWLRPGDLLVVNESKVMPARLFAHKATGGRLEILLVEPADGDPMRYVAMLTKSKKLRVGTELFVDGLEAPLIIEAKRDEGFFVLRLPIARERLTQGFGHIPLPPYLGREADALDEERYQTVYANPAYEASVAAPTAGLHFSEALLQSLADQGVQRTAVRLHVGPGTFLPVRADRIEDHVMHEERYEFPEAAAEAIQRARARGGRIIAVGTTAARVLESLEDDRVASQGQTRLFIKPGYRFQRVDSLLTNFHLPRSTLLMLVAAKVGRERLLSAYATAVQAGYRFYSYGDAMFLA